MTNILAIESSTQICSIALSVDGRISELSVSGQRSHTANMLGFVKELLDKQGVNVDDLGLIAFSGGPGSFTGIRLAAAVAKSLAYAADIPVINVSSLAVIAQAAKNSNPGLSECMVITDAKMDECYVGHYGLENDIAKSVTEDTLVHISRVESLLISNCPIVLVEKDFEGSLPIVENAEVIVVEPDAGMIIPLAQAVLESGKSGSALEVQVNYLRGKSGWKTTEQQKST